VLLAALRHPVLLAQTMATVDLISQGRLVIGAGVGGAFNEAQKSEWQAAGVVASQRARRFEEIVQIVRRLGAGEAVSFSGRHFDLDQVSIGPFPVRPEGVPILLASHWRAQQEAQMTRAAKLGSGLISISDTPDEYAWLTERVRGLNAEFGRDPAHFETVFYMTVNIDNDSNKAETEANEYLTRYYGANIWGTRWGPFGEAQRVKERMAEYVAAGAQTLVVRFASFRPEQQLERFLEQVAPAFA
jgi:alkanesulfonate monooxygenase SsuD/methylene tetrahydromethanopterin reductase-like flavin-dependent oxidoreductase (luciferase family)